MTSVSNKYKVSISYTEEEKYAISTPRPHHFLHSKPKLIN